MFGELLLTKQVNLMEVFSNFTVFTSIVKEIVVNCALFAKFTKIFPLQYFLRHGNAHCKK